MFRLEVPAHDPAQPVVFDFTYRRLGGASTTEPEPIVVDGPVPTPPDSVVDHGAYRTARLTLTTGFTEFGLYVWTSSEDPDDLAYIEIYAATVTYAPLVKGSWPLRQRQSLTGSPSWPLRQRQHGGHSGSWPLRQRQRGV